MFENLSDKLQGIVKKLKGQTRITEKELNEMLREVKLALLEADVNYKVVKEFIASIKEKALGEDVMKSLTPGQQVVKIVRDELTELLGTSESKLNISSNPPTIIMLVGLQGSGKTTLCGKLSNYLRKQGKKPLMIACDVYRPAAIKQLETLGKSLNIDVYSEEGNKNVVEVATHGIKKAHSKLCDVVIVDTAGRLQIDEKLMDELKNINEAVKMDEVLLVLDAMIGQDAINVINGFNEQLPLTGVILTKLDGDTRGGVALSARHLTNVPIKFIGTSEKLDGLELFDAERMTSRILGMGDMMGLIEKAEGIMNEEESLDSFKKMKKGKYDLEDFLKQFNQMKKLGPIENIIKMLPGAKKMGLTDIHIDPKDMARLEAIVLSMTPEERRNPDIIKASRKERIAKGCGQNVQAVNKLLTQFEQSKKMMKMMSNGNMKLPF